MTLGINLTILAKIDELDGLRSSRDDAWQVPRDEGEFLYQFALAVGAKTIIEAGTSYGFSGLFWGAALKQTGGVLHTIDNDPKKIESSKETFRQAGLSAININHFGDAAAELRKITGQVDIAFLDAGDKRLNTGYFDIIWPRVRRGGSVLTDNAITHRGELVEYVKHVRGRSDASSIELPIGNGLEWTVKLR